MKTIAIGEWVYNIKDSDMAKLEELEGAARKDQKQEHAYADHLEYIQRKYKILVKIYNAYRYP